MTSSRRPRGACSKRVRGAKHSGGTMDRRSFLQSGSLAAAAGAAIANAVVPPAEASEGRGHDWSNRNPKGEPVVKRFDEQRWLLDNIIQANGIDWDRSEERRVGKECRSRWS